MLRPRGSNDKSQSFWPSQVGRCGLFSFFVGSTYRWKLLNDELTAKGLPTITRLSDTRWSARTYATKALVHGYRIINAALEALAANTDQKMTRQEARGLAAHMNRLETGILAAVWNRFHNCSLAQQSADQELWGYTSSSIFTGSLRMRIDEYEAQGKPLSDCDYTHDSEIADVMNQSQRLNLHKDQQIKFAQEPSSVLLIM